MYALTARPLRKLTLVLAVVLLAAVVAVGDGAPAHAAPTSGFLLATPVSGSGTVSRSPAAAVFASGTPVTLIPTANAGWSFDRWELDASGSGIPLAVVMVRNTNVRAVFVREAVAAVPDRYSLTVEVAGDCCGTVTVNATASGGGIFDFATGEDVTLTAVAGSGNLRFSHWEADVPGSEATTTVRLDRDVTARAVFVIAAPPVVSVQVLGFGTVWSDAQVIAPRAGDLLYEPGSELTLRAIPISGWRFDRWMGDVANIDSTIIVTVNSDQALFAVFVPDAPDLFAISAAASGSGSVVSEPALASYRTGDRVLLTATPSDGWRFSHWEGDFFGTAAVVDVTVERNLSARAIFVVETRLQLSTSVQGEGSIARSESATGYAGGTVVGLTAIPAIDWSFDRWELDAAGSNAVTSVTMDGHRAVRAIFKYTPAELVRVLTAQQGSGTVTRSPNADSLLTGSRVTLTATPAVGWRFGHWEGDVAGVFSNIELTLTGPVSAIAVFEPINGFTLATEVSGGGTVVSNPARDVHLAGGVVVLTAQPASGWRFDRWEGDVAGLSADLIQTAVTMTSDKVIRAVFIRGSIDPVTGDAAPNAAQVPPAGGLTVVTAGTTDVQALIDAQLFEVEALFVFDPATQLWKTYIVGAPAFAQTLLSLNISDSVSIRRR